MMCKSCGADNPSEATICLYCQSQLPVTGSSSRMKILARIKASDAYARRNSPERHAQLPKVGALQKAMTIGFFVVFIGFSAMMCVVAFGVAGVLNFVGPRGSEGFVMTLLPVLFAVVPAAFVALGIFMLTKTRQQMNAMESDPIQAHAVVIVDKRTQVTGGTGDHSTRTHYFVSCERDEGCREEYQVWDGHLFGRITAGDTGVLFVRAGYALDFDRVTV